MARYKITIENYESGLTAKTVEQMAREQFEAGQPQVEVTVETVEEGAELPEVGDWVKDENPPSWSNGERLQVIEVLDDVTCNQYVIDGPNEGIVDARPLDRPHEGNEPVVLARYDGEGDAYALPASRLSVIPNRKA